MMPGILEPPRVLFLLTEIFAKGGIQRFNQTLLSACAGLKADCEVLSLHDAPDPDASTIDGATFTVRGFSGNRRGFTLAVLTTLAMRRFDWILIGHINFLRLGILLAAVRPFARHSFVLIAHGIEVWSGIKATQRMALRRVRKILCVSQYTRQRILEQAPGLAPDQLVVFPNALPQTWELSARKTSPQPSQAPVQRFILSVSRLERGDRYKGVVTVIEALSMLYDDTIHYYVVGRGSDLSFLQSVAQRCGMSKRVHFLTEINDEELVALYENCTAFVLPSGKEGFGIVFLEAMFFGAPVIAAAERGALDVVTDGATGLLVRYGDPIAVKNAIERIAGDATLAATLKAQAKSTVTAGGPFTFAALRQRFARELGLREVSPA